MIAVANAHKGKVKLTFAYGAKFSDPDKLFNAGLEGNMRRAIDFFEGDKINERALKTSSVPLSNTIRANRRRKRLRVLERKYAKTKHDADVFTPADRSAPRSPTERPSSSPA